MSFFLPSPCLFPPFKSFLVLEAFYMQPSKFVALGVKSTHLGVFLNTFFQANAKFGSEIHLLLLCALSPPEGNFQGHFKEGNASLLNRSVFPITQLFIQSNLSLSPPLIPPPLSLCGLKGTP